MMNTATNTKGMVPGAVIDEANVQLRVRCYFNQYITQQFFWVFGFIKRLVFRFSLASLS